ncbi:MAG TPA: plasmid stability protein [Chloroflexota bacterium]|nr:plasmid stability protein [Chloroflexota bacterium]
MPSLLVRDLPEETLAALKARAAQHNRSLQKEVQSILADAASGAARRLAALEYADQIRSELAAKGVRFTDSVDLIREDRER